MKVLGHHVLVEFYNCNPARLNDLHHIQASMEHAARESNATIVESVFHHFSPHGISGVVVIAESHLAIHTWPEYNYAAVDLFTCGESVNPWIAFEILKQRFEAGDFSTRELRRGIPGRAGAHDITLQHKPLTDTCHERATEPV
jgi:spermidine synthase